MMKRNVTVNQGKLAKRFKISPAYLNMILLNKRGSQNPKLVRRVKLAYGTAMVAIGQRFIKESEKYRD